MTPRKTPDLTHSLVGGLKDMISKGILQPGGRLPPERELAKKFSVNRASIRQALKALDVMGVVYQRVGDGTYLTQDASTTLSIPLEFLILVDGISFQELLEARLIVEPQLAARAAKRATEEDLAELDQAMEQLESAIASESTDLADRNLRFHEVIWRASGNRVCERMFATIHRAMSDGVAVTTMLREDGVPAAPHRKIAEAIRNHDEATAKQEMHNHLVTTARSLHKAVPAAASEAAALHTEPEAVAAASASAENRTEAREGRMEVSSAIT